MAWDTSTMLGVSAPSAYTPNEECWSYQEFEPATKAGSSSRGQGLKGAGPSTANAEVGTKKGKNGDRSFVCDGVASSATVGVTEAHPLAVVPHAKVTHGKGDRGLDAASLNEDSLAELAVAMASELADVELAARNAPPGKALVVVSDEEDEDAGLR